ncbi:MAG: hypothetical protein APF78_08105 [Sphingomonadales bacterium BRH_c3]|nr:MAG: hypothetical protein APF78_08105 [Sphingomonadales bacterium BRH_c3]
MGTAGHPALLRPGAAQLITEGALSSHLPDQVMRAKLGTFMRRVIPLADNAAIHGCRGAACKPPLVQVFAALAAWVKFHPYLEKTRGLWPD